jgi:hypothetical protein
VCERARDATASANMNSAGILKAARGNKIIRNEITRSGLGRYMQSKHFIFVRLSQLGGCSRPSCNCKSHQTHTHTTSKMPRSLLATGNFLLRIFAFGERWKLVLKLNCLMMVIYKNRDSQSLFCSLSIKLTFNTHQKTSKYVMVKNALE